MRCFEGPVYDMQRGAWVACERCSGSGRVVVYLSTLRQSAPHGSAACDPLPAGVLVMGLRSLCWGVGRRNGRLHCQVGTPPRKIRHYFQECKHTSLVFLVGEVVEVHRRFIAICCDASFVASRGRTRKRCREPR
jgi:hypothetical protein